MAVVTCPSCLGMVRSPAVGKYRGFVTCAKCGHRFLVSIDEEPSLTKGETRAMSTEEIAESLKSLVRPEASGDEDITRESTHREEAPAPHRGKIQLRIVGTQDVTPLERFQFVIGREGADLPLQDPTISRRHAIIENHSDRYLLKDLGSTNGTYVNGRRVTVEFLEVGDIIQAGKVRLRFEARRGA